MKVKIKKPHVAPHHIKHSVCFATICGTALEVMHVVYPAGLIMIAAGAIIAVYEPYLVHEVSEVTVDETEI